MMINDSMIYVRWMLYVNTLYIIPYHVCIYIYDHQVLNCPDVKWSFSLWLLFCLSLCFFLNGPGHCRDSPTRAWIRARWLKGRTRIGFTWTKLLGGWFWLRIQPGCKYLVRWYNQFCKMYGTTNFGEMDGNYLQVLQPGCKLL